MNIICRFAGCALIAITLSASAQAQAPAPPAAPAKVDNRVKDPLDKIGLKYKINQWGTCEVGFTKTGYKDVTVLARSTTTNLGGGKLEIRDITAVAYVTDKPLSADLANKLLLAAGDHALGVWQVIKVDDKYAVFFSVRLEANASPDALVEAIKVVARAVFDSQVNIFGSVSKPDDGKGLINPLQ